MHDTRSGNYLLDALPDIEYSRLAPHLKPVTSNLGDVLHEGGDLIRHVYFPVKSTISVLTLLPDNIGIEVNMTGREGMVGIPVVLGVETASRKAICQIPGRTLQLPVEVLRHELGMNGQLQKLLLRYVHVQMSQIAQSAACNRRHEIEHRLARWLLTSADHAERDELPLTHEFLSQMLGTRRSGVSIAANALQRLGLISYRRGAISVLDREGLEEYSCPCYGIVARDYQDFLTVLKEHSSNGASPNGVSVGMLNGVSLRESKSS
jgi:CRP-like cAMP-binding protein